MQARRPAGGPQPALTQVGVGVVRAQAVNRTSPPRHLGRTVFLLLLLSIVACRKDEKPNAPATPESAASQPAVEGDAPESHAIVAREGDHLVVIVDLAATDRRGRKVAKASFDPAAPAAIRISEPVRTEEGLTLEARIPDGTKSVKIVGTSDGGAEWSIVVRTSLGG
jgi:hypothetical protein